jgi:ABC-type taurine transport system ATPase subunit
MVDATMVQDNAADGLTGLHYAQGILYGTYTAKDFTVTLGFNPKKVRVVNLTDRIEAIHYVNALLDAGNNAKSLLTVAAGTVTYEAAGIAVSGKTFTVTVATKGLQTDNDDVLYEAWG